MQLTGGTARSFNLNNLVTDWSYNLDSGVRVLSDKYDVVLAGFPANLRGIAAANRSVLENWIYALEFYNHGHMPSAQGYSQVILSYIAASPPPVRLSGFFNPAGATPPGSVISGYLWSDGYVALPTGVWVDKNGNQYAGPVHQTGGAVNPVLPIITVQPANQIASLGGSATFSVSAVGNSALTYQWRFNGAVVGGNSSSLNLSGIATTQSGTYSVTVSSAAGSTPSALATLTVNTAGALRVTDGIKILEAPPYFLGASPATADATIQNASGSSVSLDRLEVDGDFRNASGTLVNTVTWDVVNFSTPLALAPGQTYHFTSGHTQSPFPFVPCTVTGKMYAKFHGIAGLQAITDSAVGASAVLTFQTLDEYALTVDTSPYGTVTMVPDAYYHGAGTQVTLTATPDANHLFSAWTYSDDSVASQQNPYAFTITRNTGLRIVFVPMIPRINISSAGGCNTLTWPNWGTAFNLEVSTSGANPLDWASAGVTPVLNGNFYTATLPVSAGAKLYRLTRPQ